MDRWGNKFLARESLKEIIPPEVFERTCDLCTLAVSSLSPLERHVAMDILNRIFGGTVQLNKILINETINIYFSKEGFQFWHYVTKMPSFYNTFLDNFGDIHYVCVN